MTRPSDDMPPEERFEPDYSDLDPDRTKDFEGELLTADFAPTIHLHVAPGEPDSPLNPQQEARVSALYHARAVLEKRGGGPLVPASAATPPDPQVMRRMANYILTGDPDANVVEE